MSDSLTVVNTTGLTVAPGGQIVEPDNPTEVADCEQVLVTAAVGADVPERLRATGRTYAVTLGEVTLFD